MQKNNNPQILISKLIKSIILMLLLSVSVLINNQKFRINEIIRNNFFIIDSNNLKSVKSHIYGFCISKKGILTDNYYKNLDYNEEPEPTGTYVMIRKNGSEVIINQDYNGGFGLYFYENKQYNYFSLSNSFLLLVEHLSKNDMPMTLNREFADNFITTPFYQSLMRETMIKEIIFLPSNALIKINIQKNKIQINYIDYQERTVPFESEEGINLIDKWVDKWGYIFRSLQKANNNILMELSGGFDTRIILSILLSSGINLNNISIHSKTYKSYFEDLEIATNICSKFKIKLNEINIDNDSTIFNIEDTLISSMYAKLGFHNWFSLLGKFFKKPRFLISGYGGEIIRGYPMEPIGKYINDLLLPKEKINPLLKKYYNSSLQVLNRSIQLVIKKWNFINDYEISTLLYLSGRNRNHFGRLSVENYISNIFTISPSIDPDILKIKYNINERTQHDLVSFIYVRFAHDLIYFPFQKNRTLNVQSIIKAEKINNEIGPYRIKSDYNQNFYTDSFRKLPVANYSTKKNIDDYLEKIFKTHKFVHNFKRLYDFNIYKSLLKKKSMILTIEKISENLK